MCLGLGLLDIGSYVGVGVVSQHHLALPWIGLGNRFLFLGASTSPHVLVGGGHVVQGCQPWHVDSLGGFWSSLDSPRVLPLYIQYVIGWIT